VIREAIFLAGRSHGLHRAGGIALLEAEIGVVVIRQGARGIGLAQVLDRRQRRFVRLGQCPFRLNERRLGDGGLGNREAAVSRYFRA